MKIGHGSNDYIEFFCLIFLMVDYIDRNGSPILYMLLVALMVTRLWRDWE